MQAKLKPDIMKDRDVLHKSMQEIIVHKLTQTEIRKVPIWDVLVSLKIPILFGKTKVNGVDLEKTA